MQHECVHRTCKMFCLCDRFVFITQVIIKDTCIGTYHCVHIDRYNVHIIMHIPAARFIVKCLHQKHIHRTYEMFRIACILPLRWPWYTWTVIWQKPKGKGGVHGMARCVQRNRRAPYTIHRILIGCSKSLRYSWKRSQRERIRNRLDKLLHRL